MREPRYLDIKSCGGGSNIQFYQCNDGDLEICIDDADGDSVYFCMPKASEEILKEWLNRE